MVQTSKRSLNVLREVTASLPLDFFRALGDPNRIALIAWLACQREPRTVTEIASSGCCPVDLSVVSRHLRTLLHSGVLVSERRGREVYYRLHLSSLVGVLRRTADLLETCCMPRGAADQRQRKD